MMVSRKKPMKKKVETRMISDVRELNENVPSIKQAHYNIQPLQPFFSYLTNGFRPGTFNVV